MGSGTEDLKDPENDISNYIQMHQQQHQQQMQLIQNQVNLQN
jgi:hypothetical protein